MINRILENKAIIKVKKYKHKGSNYIMFTEDNYSLNQKNNMLLRSFNYFHSSNYANINKFNTENLLTMHQHNNSMEIQNNINGDSMINQIKNNIVPENDSNTGESILIENIAKSNEELSPKSKKYIISVNLLKDVDEKDKSEDKIEKVNEKYGKKGTANFSIREIMNSSDEAEDDDKFEKKSSFFTPNKDKIRESGFLFDSINKKESNLEVTIFNEDLESLLMTDL